MNSVLDGVQLIEYFNHLLWSSDLTKKKAILCTGLQPDRSCVVNAKVFILPDGQLMDPDESPYIWLDKDFMYDSDKIKSVDITPEIKLPLSTTPLCKLVESLRIICKHNFIPALVMIASVVMSFHYSEVKNV